MSKNLGVICSVIGGIVIELIFFYIWSAFEDETHVIIGVSCFLGGSLVFISLIRSIENKYNQRKGIDIKGKIKSVLYTFIVGVSIIVTALVLFAKDKKDNNDEYERQKQLQHLDQVYDQIDKENELATKAKTVLEQAKSHYDEANSMSDFISDIDFNNSISDMSSPEISAYLDIRNISVYFYNIEDAQTYYNEEKYEKCIEFSKSAIERFQEAKNAYIGYRGSLDKYR